MRVVVRQGFYYTGVLVLEQSSLKIIINDNFPFVYVPKLKPLPYCPVSCFELEGTLYGALNQHCAGMCDPIMSLCHVHLEYGCR